MKRLAQFILALLLLSACRERPSLETGPCLDSAGGEVAMECDLNGWEHRPYDLFAPDVEGPFPLLIGLHGGGGNSDASARGACPNGDLESAGCLHAMAMARGYAVVYPNGTPNGGLRKRARSWNAGGGEADWRCTGGRACEEDVDDVQYVRDLIDDIAARLPIDRDRVFSTGISNGGAMSHRLGCELDGIAAIAPVGGAMQYTTTQTCAPVAPVGVMHIHGTEDPCWVYDGGVPDCPIGQKDKKFISVDRTMSDWSDALNCSGESAELAMPNPADDDVESFRVDYADCDAPLSLIRMEGGGHTWPDGHGYFAERVVGRVSTDFGNEVILDFFDRWDD